MWKIAGRITAPTLVIGGRYDRLVDIRVAPVVAELIPDSRLLILDRVGHVAQMEQPMLVARGMLALLREVWATRPESATINVTMVDTPHKKALLATKPVRA
jgi:hypothetical protein